MDKDFKSIIESYRRKRESTETIKINTFGDMVMDGNRKYKKP